MPLSPEERAKIFEEEKVRAEAQRHYANAPKKRGMSCCGAFVLICIALILLSSINQIPTGNSSGSYPPPSGTEPHSEDLKPSDLPAPDYRLKKVSETNETESDYIIVSGEVVNTGSTKIENVEAMTTYYDRNGEVVKTESALIEFNPILPGQRSPYKTMTTDNPAIKKMSTRFRQMMGGEIETTDATSHRRKK